MMNVKDTLYNQKNIWSLLFFANVHVHHTYILIATVFFLDLDLTFAPSYFWSKSGLRYLFCRAVFNFFTRSDTKVEWKLHSP